MDTKPTNSDPVNKVDIPPIPTVALSGDGANNKIVLIIAIVIVLAIMAAVSFLNR